MSEISPFLQSIRPESSEKLYDFKYNFLYAATDTSINDPSAPQTKLQITTVWSLENKQWLNNGFLRLLKIMGIFCFNLLYFILLERLLESLF